MSSSALAAGLHQLRGKLAAEERKEESDEQLLHAFTMYRDESAFGLLVRRHGQMVLHVCRRVLGHEEDAEDAFQAVFLVLVRNAESLRNKASLASFLHGTAYRIAMKAKQTAARRRKHEKQKPAKPAVDPTDELSWREVRLILDEEIANLPEIYRSVFVLCCLENLSRAETAQRLGLKERTVLSRLSQARKRLSQVLACRGVELTAVLTASALITPPASALPARLIAKTMKAVLATASGKELASVVSATVVELVESAAALIGGKAKIATVLLLTASMFAGAGVYLLAGPQREQGQRLLSLRAGEGTGGAPQSEKLKTAKTEVIQGRVLDPDGKPKAGVKLLLLGKGEKLQQLGTTAEDGRFTISLPKKSKTGYLVAQAEGSGIDFVGIPMSDPKKPVELRLVKDRPIHGRVINTEGKPVPRVRVAVDNLGVYANNSLDSFLAVWEKQQNVTSGLPNGEKHIWEEAEPLLAATTDDEGHFAILHAGEERLISLHLTGGGIAAAQVWVVNRRGFDPKPYNAAVLRNSSSDALKLFGNSWRLHGPELCVIAEAGKTIEGVVKDADSNEGRPGVEVIWSKDGDGRLLPGPLVKARTDEHGRYTLRGVRKTKSYMLEVLNDSATGYLRSQVIVPDTTGYEPITADIPIKKGVNITGKVIDKATGKAIPGWVHIDFLRGNPFVKDYPPFDSSAWIDQPHTNDEGIFRVVTVPGPVLLMGGPDPQRIPDDGVGHLKYKPVEPDPDYPQYFSQKGQRPSLGVPYVYYGYDGNIRALHGNFCKVLNVEAGASVVKQDILLEEGDVLPVRIRDADGRPVAKTWVTGMSPQNWNRPIACEADSCAAYHLESGKSRLMVFFEPTKKLAATWTLQGDEKRPLTVKLGPAGAIKGQLLDTDGKPLARVVVDVRYRDREAEEMDHIIHKNRQVVTDAQGKFTFDELIPQLKFELAFHHSGRRLQRERKPADAVIEVRSGECRDLGAIKAR